ncbi:MAG: hypothetical protein ACRYFU_04825 [Janthinobacterium lividum]
MGLSQNLATAVTTLAFAGVLVAQAPIVRVPPLPAAQSDDAPQMVPAPQESQPAPAYPVQSPGYPVQQPGYPAQPPAYPAQPPAYPAQPPGYPAQPPAYPAPPPGTSAGLQPRGVAQALAELTSQPASHTAFTFDRDMLQGLLGNRPIGLNSVTVESYRFHEPAFYVPEELAALRHAYDAAGWKHLVDAHATPREQATPVKPITDLWLHYHGTEIDDVAVLIRASRQMNVIQASGMIRPLDLVHLGGHFGIPKVDPGAVMVPAPPER